MTPTPDQDPNASFRPADGAGDRPLPPWLEPGALPDAYAVQPIACPVVGCGQTFATVDAWDAHRADAHGHIKCTHPGCEKRFGTLYMMGAHQRLAHPQPAANGGAPAFATLYEGMHAAVLAMPDTLYRVQAIAHLEGLRLFYQEGMRFPEGTPHYRRAAAAPSRLTDTFSVDTTPEGTP